MGKKPLLDCRNVVEKTNGSTALSLQDSRSKHQEPNFSNFSFIPSNMAAMI